MSRQEILVQIDPGRALCWEQSDTIRVGFERVVARVPAPSAEAQRVLQTLIYGIPEAAFHELQNRPGPDPHGIKALLHALQPALVRHRRNTSEATKNEVRNSRSDLTHTAIYDDGRPVPGLQHTLETQRLCRFDRRPVPPELVIQVVRFLEPLERTRRWLGAGIPHLVVRFTDELLRVGPLVSAAGSPCHVCEALHLVDADPALPALAVQLYGTTPGSETPANSPIIGVLAAHFIRAWKNRAEWIHHSQIVVPVSRREASGLAMLRTIVPHPECGCTIEHTLNGRYPPRRQTETEPSAPAQHRQTPKPARYRVPG